MKIIMDCHYVTYRSAYGMENLSYDGQQTHIIFDFMRQVLKLALKFKTNQFIFCFDSANSYRELVYPAYKDHRKDNKKAPEEMAIINEIRRQRFELREKVLPYIGFKNIFMQSGYESDDIIALIVKNNSDEEFVVVAKDKDLYQFLESDRVKLYDFKKLYTQANFEDEYLGLKPEQWSRVKAIAGCRSDNVAGIEGIGDKTAVKYLLGMLKNGKIFDKINSDESKRLIETNLLLVSLPYSNGRKPLKVDLVIDEIDLDMMKSCFGQYGFRYFLREEQWDKWESAFIESIVPF
jgi:DNA polymerase-1